MEIDIVAGKLGEVGSYKVHFSKGKLLAESLVSEGPLEANLVVSLDAGMVLDALAKAIPGTLDDTVIAVIKAELLK